MGIIIIIVLISLAIVYKHRSDKDIDYWRKMALRKNEGYSNAVSISEETVQLLEDQKVTYSSILESLDVKIDEFGNIDAESLVEVAKKLGHDPEENFEEMGYWLKKLIDIQLRRESE